ncbi:MAG TPA: lysophospholipid acyltransferase family protein [Solirubrobacteraceae bacterium]
MSPNEPITRTYRVVMAILSVIVRHWGRLEVSGLDQLPESGPILLAANHDSYWDPVTGGIAALPRRQIRALAKASLWKVKGLHWILNGMGQIPVTRGVGDTGAFDRAIAELRGGACIGLFPEGTRSLGRPLRARSGFGRLAEAVPEARLIGCAIAGTTDIPRFPRRPRIRVRFFAPAGGGLRPGESATELSARILAELRAIAPVTPAGRRPSKPPGGADA